MTENERRAIFNRKHFQIFSHRLQRQLRFDGRLSGQEDSPVYGIKFASIQNDFAYLLYPARWFPVVSGAWLLAALLAVIVAPGTARRVGVALGAREGIAAPGAETAAADAPRLAAARDPRERA